MNSRDLVLSAKCKFKYAGSVCRICSGSASDVLQKTFPGYHKRVLRDGRLMDMLEMLLESNNVEARSRK